MKISLHFWVLRKSHVEIIDRFLFTCLVVVILVFLPLTSIQRHIVRIRIFPLAYIGLKLIGTCLGKSSPERLILEWTFHHRGFTILLLHCLRASKVLDLINMHKVVVPRRLLLNLDKFLLRGLILINLLSLLSLFGNSLLLI